MPIWFDTSTVYLPKAYYLYDDTAKFMGSSRERTLLAALFTNTRSRERVTSIVIIITHHCQLKSWRPSRYQERLVYV